MDLLLWRHAEAADGSPDDARELTANGVRQAERMARWLDRHAPKDLRIIVSPAVRTQQTVQAWTHDYETVAELGTHARAQDLIRAAGWPDSRRPVMIVGHQPTLGEVASLLLHGAPTPTAFKKGAVWWLRHRLRDGEPQTVLHSVMTAEMAGGKDER
ncbi:phosphohistidine phosphatase SixA [Uliginosibacterium sp. sgz301328]|uniref:phosphohistidine phosphatase SixA n=1 Tax=Uliginosibacterium sp. sgz301328 TaxID=3243764 RepID=UPI00359ED0FD